MMLSGGYDLTIMEQDEVALAASMNMSVDSPLFSATITVMVVMMLVAICMFYFVACRQLQIRIAHLNTQTRVRKTVYSKWNYISLKDEQKRLENAITDELLDTMVNV